MTYLLLALALLFVAFGAALAATESSLDAAVERTSEYTNRMMQFHHLCQTTTGDEREFWKQKRDEFRAEWEEDPNFEQNSGLMRRKQ